MDGFQASSNFIEDLVVLIDTWLDCLSIQYKQRQVMRLFPAKKNYVGGIERTTNPSKVASNGIYDCDSL